MASRAALLKIAPVVAAALEARDGQRVVELIRHRFPAADMNAVLDELGCIESLKDANVRLDAGNLEGALAWLGRNHAPAALRDWHDAGRVDLEQMRSVLLSVWEMVEYPCRALPRRTWLEWFERVGFVSDGAPMPTEPLEVWRAQVGRTVGLAWARDREQAVWFHERNTERGWPGRLLHTFAPPTAVLGLIDGGRGEREVIVNPRHLARGRALNVGG